MTRLWTTLIAGGLLVSPVIGADMAALTGPATPEETASIRSQVAAERARRAEWDQDTLERKHARCLVDGYTANVSDITLYTIACMRLVGYVRSGDSLMGMGVPPPASDFTLREVTK
jgi:hypothetical protein